MRDLITGWRLRLSTISLNNKIFFSTLFVILVISAAIALLARWILVSSLESELQTRGVAIAHSIAERGSGFILENNKPMLLSLIYDEATLRERRQLINYIFITDREDNILSHTLTKPFPKTVPEANPLRDGAASSMALLDVDGRPTYDIAVPIREGIYRIGSVHVGLSKVHMDQLVATLRTTFLGFISAVVVIIFIISLKLAKSITRPLTQLTKISDEISRGNFDFKFDSLKHGVDWDVSKCPAYRDTNVPCWHVDDQIQAHDLPPEALHNCKECLFYSKRQGDEVVQLADSFMNMVWSIRLYRRRLQESEAKYKSLFDSGPDPIFVVDAFSGEILDGNPRVEELYLYTKGEFLGMNFVDLGPEHNKDFLSHFEAGYDTTGFAYFPKMLHYKKGGQPFFVNMHACPISYKGRQAIIVAATDITEMIEKDAQLIQSSKMKTLGEMSAGIAHELNQPLNAIKMGSDYLAMAIEQDLDLTPDQTREVVRDMSVQVDRATEIINNLRAFGRKSSLITESLDLNKPVRGVLSIVRRQFKLENVEFELDLAEGLPMIRAQDNRLQQVFFNIVTNARDAILERGQRLAQPYDGLIRVKTFLQADGRVGVSFTDNGIGISKENRDKIFEPFFTTKEAGQGMGLGLAISYGIIKDYGGEIQIMGKEGEGTTFTISFPALKPQS